MGNAPSDVLVAEVFCTKVVIHDWSICHTIQHLLESGVVIEFDITAGLKVDL